MKFIILSLKRNLLPFIFVLIAICLVIFSKSNLTATKNGLTLWATCVVPSLFPFFVITNLLSHTKVVHLLGKLFDKFMRPIFNVPGIGSFPFIMGLISGYPMGAKIVADFRKDGLISKDEGERLLAFTNNSGPLFIISSVGISLFGDTTTGFLLLGTHILSCITVGIILAKFSKNHENYKHSYFKKTYDNNKFTKKNISTNSNTVTLKNLGEVLGNSINNSISTLLMIGGFVVIFSVIISILNSSNAIYFLGKLFNPILSIFGFDLSFAKPVFSGIIELTNGVSLVSNVHIKEISQNVVLSAFLLGFGGFSVLLQVFSIVSKTDLSMKKYFTGKLLQGIFAGFYTFLALKFIPFLNLDIIQTSANTNTNITTVTNSLYSYFYELGILVIAIFFVLLIFAVFKRIYSKVYNE